MASLTWWTWVWANSGRWWRPGRPGVLQSMGPQRVRHDWATEQPQPSSFYQTTCPKSPQGTITSRSLLRFKYPILNPLSCVLHLTQPFSGKAQQWLLPCCFTLIPVSCPPWCFLVWLWVARGPPSSWKFLHNKLFTHRYLSLCLPSYHIWLKQILGNWKHWERKYLSSATYYHGLPTWLSRKDSICNQETRECMTECHSVVSDSLRHHGLYSPWNSPGQKTGMGSLSLLQGIFPTQGSNLGLLRCRRILY